MTLAVMSLAFSACSNDEDEDYGPNIPEATIIIEAPYGGISDLVLNRFKATLINAHNEKSWTLPQPVQNGKTFTITLKDQPSGHYTVKANGNISFTRNGKRLSTNFEVMADHYELSVEYPSIRMAISYSDFFQAPTNIPSRYPTPQ